MKTNKNHHDLDLWKVSISFDRIRSMIAGLVNALRRREA